VGSKEENPKEERLPLPPGLAAAPPVHEAFDFGFGAGARADDGVAAPLRKKAGGGGGGAGGASQGAALGDEPIGSQVCTGWALEAWSVGRAPLC
jgi:hypothetical protein